MTHRTIDRVTVDIDRRLHLNTAISAVMELANALQEFLQAGIRNETDRSVAAEAITSAFLLLAPLAPHLAAEELGRLIGPPPGADYAWPQADPELLREEEADIVIQVNGKVRGQVRVPAGSGEDEVFRRAIAQPRIAAHLQGRPVRRRVFLPNRLLNIVVGVAPAEGSGHGADGSPIR
jgi:leucyl-tRNA synthetase